MVWDIFWDAYDSSGAIVGINPLGANWLNLYHLYPVSLTNIHEGPEYTYHSGAHSTTVDYIIADASLSSIISRCWTTELYTSIEIAYNENFSLFLKVSNSAF